MNRHATTPLAIVANAMTAIIGRSRARALFASDASCHNKIVSISMNTARPPESHEEVEGRWRLKAGDREIFAVPKAGMVRTMGFNH